MKTLILAILSILCFTSLAQGSERNISKIYQDDDLITSFTYYNDGRIKEIQRHDPCPSKCYDKEVFIYNNYNQLVEIRTHRSGAIQKRPYKYIEFEYNEFQQLAKETLYWFNKDQEKHSLYKTQVYYYEGNQDEFPNVELEYDKNGELLEERYYNKSELGIFETYEIYPRDSNPKKYKVAYNFEGEIHSGQLPWYLRTLVCKKCEFPISSIVEVDMETEEELETVIDYEIEFDDSGYPTKITSKQAYTKDFVFRIEYD